MSIAAFDVHYLKDGRASAAAVLFSDYTDAEPESVHTRLLPASAAYIPGAFYRRELPVLLALLETFGKVPDEMIVDGYVMLGNRPGLGWHLYASFTEKIPVIGVAKTRFAGASAAKVFRGRSKHPLYVTAAGIDLSQASEKIRTMHGPFRIPTSLKQVDFLARETIRHS